MNAVVAYFLILISLLQLVPEGESCVNLTTIDTTWQTLHLKRMRNENESSIEMVPFLIRTENGKIGITLSETSNDTGRRSYQLFLKHLGDSMGCLKISNIWNSSVIHSKDCNKAFSMDGDDVQLIIGVHLTEDGVITLKVNNKIKFIYKVRGTPINVRYISVASTSNDSYNEFYFNCYDKATDTIKY